MTKRARIRADGALKAEYRFDYSQAKVIRRTGGRSAGCGSAGTGRC